MRPPVSRPRAALALCAAALLAAPVARAAVSDSTNTPPLPVSIGTFPQAPCHGDSVWLVATSGCSPCFDLLAFGLGSDGRLRLEVNQLANAACSTLPCQVEKMRVPLGVFAAGRHAASVEVVWHYPPDSLGSGGTRVLQRVVAFDVGRCSGDSLPFVNRVVIGGPAPCATCPPEACPGRPIPVGLQGALPDDCWSLLGFEELPLMSPMDRPVLRLTVREPCPHLDRVCLGMPVPFSVGLALAPRPAGPHELEIQVAVRSCTDSTSLKLHAMTFAYVVKDSCPEPPPPAACAWPFLSPRRPERADSAGTWPGGCDLRLQPGGRGPVWFAARSQSVPLAGLQGDLEPTPFLRIVNVEPAGAAAGMTLDWTPRGNGASFVLFSAKGAPIPADTWAPVLKVTVEADSSVDSAMTGHVGGLVRAASDSLGTSVPLCPVMTLVWVAARVCVDPAGGCDANRDGLTNVADLVRMVRCLRDPAACPDTVAARPDCNGDGAFHLDDVFCCARTILGRPRDGGGRGPGALAVSFGEPRLEGPLLLVPLRVRGAGDLAGALLRLEYPSDRWIAVDPATAGGDAARAAAAGGWTPLLEPGADDVLVGLLRLDPDAPADLEVMLAFALRPGAAPGGTLRVGSSDLTASDGTPVDLDLSGLSAALEPAGGGVVAGVALSPARPNPASGATAFVVSLPAAGVVDLAMYDLAGRRVATLWRGALPAGSREFTWRPGRAPSGVYFARLVVDGVVRSSRVALKLAH